MFSVFAGRKDRDNMDHSFGTAFILVIIFELLLTAALLLFTAPFLKVFGVTGTSYNYALTYYRIVALGCLFQGLTLVFCDFVRVSGKPLMGMCVTGVGAVTNIILDALFVVVLDWGVAGAAWATVSGQIVSSVFGAYQVFRGGSIVRIRRETFHFQSGLSKKIVSCGFAFWVTQMAMGFITLVYNSQLGKYGGDAAISVYAVVASIMTFVIMPASGISQGIQPIIGNNFGSGKYDRVMSTLYQASIFSITVTGVIWLIVMVFPQQILTAFGGTEKMLEIGVTGLRINFCITPVLGFVMLATTFFQSIAKPLPSIAITMLRQIVFLIPCIYIFPLFMGTNGIFFAQPISDGLALILSIFFVRRQHRNLGGNMDSPVWNHS